MEHRGDGLRIVVEAGPEGATARVRLAGTLDLAAQSAVRRLMGRLVGGHPSAIEFDLRGLDVIETVCAGYLAREQLSCESAGIAFRLCDPQPVPRQLLRLAGATVAAQRDGAV